MVKCPYTVLGVDRDADDASIKKAYRKSALIWHPDKNPGDENATTKFQEIGSAYAILSCPEKRKYYDRTGQSKDDDGDDDDGGLGRNFPFGDGFDSMDFADVMRMFSEMFGDVDGCAREMKMGPMRDNAGEYGSSTGSSSGGPGIRPPSGGPTSKGGARFRFFSNMNNPLGSEDEDDEWFDLGLGSNRAGRRDADAGRTGSTHSRGKKKKRKKGRADEEAIFEQFLDGLMANSDSENENENENVTGELFSDFVEQNMTISDVRGRKRYCCDICSTECRKMDTLVSHLDEAHKAEFERFIALNVDSTDDSDDDDAFDMFNAANPFGPFSTNSMRHPRMSRSFAADMDELDNVMDMMMGIFPSTAPFRVHGNPRRPAAAGAHTRGAGARHGNKQTSATVTQSARNARCSVEPEWTQPDMPSDSSKRVKPNRRRRNVAQQRAAAKR